jgi:phage terminase small subunit
VKLKGRPLKFAEFILRGDNQTKAYKKAGYKPKSDAAAGTCAARLLRNVRVSQYLEERREEIAKKIQQETNITVCDVILELKRIGFSRINKILSFNGSTVTLKNSNAISDDDLAAIESVKEGKDGIAIKLYDKVGPLTKIGEHLGAWKPNGSNSNLSRVVNVTVRVIGAKRPYQFHVQAN